MIVVNNMDKLIIVLDNGDGIVEDFEDCECDSDGLYFFLMDGNILYYSYNERELYHIIIIENEQMGLLSPIRTVYEMSVNNNKFGIKAICHHCEEEKLCTFDSDPYDDEICGDNTKYLICEHCYNESCEGI